MTKIINNILCVLKMFLLLICFVLTFYVVINDYRRLDKDLFLSVTYFIPFFILFILFSVNFILKQKSVNTCLFYNVTCTLVFIMLLFVLVRTTCDTNMIYHEIFGYDINFYYFYNTKKAVTIMLYSLCVSNLLLMFKDVNIKKKIV